ncbi:MAG: RNA 2',3'-cyclic phosphodiesterase, partial [Pigmentiphaga sp.]
MPDDYIRCFVALAPDTATRQRLQALPRMGRARPVLPEDLHLTLAFLGDLDAARAQALASALPPLAAAMPPLQADGLALWPTPQRARVIVASYVAVPEVVVMHEQVAALGVELGITAEARRYRPHI